MQILSVCGIETNYDPSLLSPTALVLEVLRCKAEKLPWFYYRDILMSAQAAGLLVIVSHFDKNPFWWIPFDNSITFLPPMTAILERQAAHDAPKTDAQKH